MVPRNPMASHDPTVPRDPDAAAGEPDRRAEPGPVDWDHLRAVTLADPALQREVLGLFLGQSRDILAAVKGLPDDTAALAHTMKGAARAIGASEVADIAGHLENAARSRPGAAGPLARDLVARLAAAIDTASAAIAGFLRDGPAS